MSDPELRKQIVNLEAQINSEEEDYRIGIKKQTHLLLLREMRTHIRRLKDDLQKLLDKESPQV